MNISAFQASDMASLKQALGIAALRKSMNQDASTVATLLQDMKEVNAKPWSIPSPHTKETTSI